MACRNKNKLPYGIVYYHVLDSRYALHRRMGCAAAVTAVLLTTLYKLQTLQKIGRELRLEEFVTAKLFLILLKVERLGLILLFLHVLYSA